MSTDSLLRDSLVMPFTSLIFLLVLSGILILLGLHIRDLMMNLNGVLHIFGKHLKFSGYI